MVLVLLGLALGATYLLLGAVPPVVPAVLIAPLEGSPEWVAQALVATVGTGPVEVTELLFAADGLLAEWRPSGVYWEAGDRPQRRAWLEAQVGAGKRITADHLHVRDRAVAWWAWLGTNADLALGRPPSERLSVLALDEDGRIRTWTLFPPDACAVEGTSEWPCSDIGPP